MKNPSTSNILQLAKELISIESTTDKPDELKKIVQIAKEELKGFTVESFSSESIPSLLIHNIKPGTKHFRLILNAHLDVVPGTTKQFVPLIDKGKLFGRGAFDMKGASSVMILLFTELAKKIDYPLAIQLVTDEEIGGQNGTKYQIEKGITADFVIAGEFTNNQIINRAKSPLWIRVKTIGKASHAAYPWLGENAIWKMYSILNKLDQLYPIPKNSSWKTTINVAKIETQNSAFNRVPDECIAWLDIRVIPEEENLVLENITKLLPKDIEIEIVVNEKPAFTNLTNPFVIALQKTIKKFSNDPGNIIGANGASDIRFYNTMVNVAGVEFGPKGSGAHSDEEYVDIKSLEIYYQILKDFLLSIK